MEKAKILIVFCTWNMLQNSNACWTALWLEVGEWGGSIWNNAVSSKTPAILPFLLLKSWTESSLFLSPQYLQSTADFSEQLSWYAVLLWRAFLRTPWLHGLSWVKLVTKLDCFSTTAPIPQLTHAYSPWSLQHLLFFSYRLKKTQTFTVQANLWLSQRPSCGLL